MTTDNVGSGQVVVPSNADLAARGKTQSAEDVVRSWIARHPRPNTPLLKKRIEWLDWAATNFLADPEVSQHLVSVAAIADELREMARKLSYTPLSERESGKISDYSRGFHAAAQILLNWAQELAGENS